MLSRLVLLVLVPLLAALAAFELPYGFAQGGPKKSDAVVKVSAKAEKPGDDGKQVVTVTLTMEKGWHTYANPVGLEDLAEAATAVTLSANGKPLDAKVEYPPGKLVKDNVVGNYKIYEDTATIKAAVTRTKGDAGPLEVTVKFQACTETKCLLPATVKVKAQ